MFWLLYLLSVLSHNEQGMKYDSAISHLRSTVCCRILYIHADIFMSSLNLLLILGSVRLCTHTRTRTLLASAEGSNKHLEKPTCMSGGTLCEPCIVVDQSALSVWCGYNHVGYHVYFSEHLPTPIIGWGDLEVGSSVTVVPPLMVFWAHDHGTSALGDKHASLYGCRGPVALINVFSFDLILIKTPHKIP